MSDADLSSTKKKTRTERLVLSPIHWLDVAYSVVEWIYTYHVLIDGKILCGVRMREYGCSRLHIAAILYTRDPSSCKRCIRIVRKAIAEWRRTEGSKPPHEDHTCTCTEHVKPFCWRCRTKGCDTRSASEPCMVTGSLFRYEKLAEARAKRAATRAKKAAEGKRDAEV